MKAQKIIEFIDNLFSDTDVTQEQTLEDLEAIQDAVEGKIEALRSDMDSR